MKTITQMELTGMCLDMPQVLKAEKELSIIRNTNQAVLDKSPLIKTCEWHLQREDFIKTNKKLKKKVRPIHEFKTKFNPNSNQQIQKLLHEQFGFDVIDTTDTGQPSTGAKVLQKHLNKLINQYNLTEEEIS